MDIEKTISKLKAKKEKLEETTHKYDNYVRLCRTKWYNNHRNNIDVARKTSAINLAIDLINKRIVEIDLHNYALQIFPVTLEDIWSDYINKSCSIYLSERKECARYLIDNFLPICKREVLSCI